jgi:tetratricopeptide (TPR) repeat protein
MLNSFWYEKAQQHFDAITKWNPACAMAWWGLAMTNWHPLWDRPNAQALAHGRDALANARSASEISPRERAFIQALGAFYTTDGDYLARAHAYERAMARVHATYPADNEAAALYALALLATAQASPPDKTYAREKQAAQLLDGVLAREPDHPGALHYLIHAYDSPPLAHYALAAARTYARIAPSVPHAQHTPSHIFVRRRPRKFQGCLCRDSGAPCDRAPAVDRGRDADAGTPRLSMVAFSMGASHHRIRPWPRRRAQRRHCARAGQYGAPADVARID